MGSGDDLRWEAGAVPTEPPPSLNLNSHGRLFHKDSDFQEKQESRGYGSKVKPQWKGAGVQRRQEPRHHFTVRLSRWASQLTPLGFSSGALDAKALPLLAELLSAWQPWSRGCLC